MAENLERKKKNLGIYLTKVDMKVCGDSGEMRENLKREKQVALKIEGRKNGAQESEDIGMNYFILLSISTSINQKF